MNNEVITCPKCGENVFYEKGARFARTSPLLSRTSTSRELLMSPVYCCRACEEEIDLQKLSAPPEDTPAPKIIVN